MYRIKKSLLYSFIILAIFIVNGCTHTDSSQTQKDFNTFIDKVFIEEVQSDSITLNYTLSQPEKYGIEQTAPTFGDYSIDSMKELVATSENYLATLKEISYQQLTHQQQLTYDILKASLEQNKKSADYLLYTEILSPTVGIQAQLPVLLAEYNFYTKNDVENYLSLLPSINTFFDDIITFEKEKSSAGLFMSDSSADAIIEQCRSFIKNKNQNLLIEVFNNKISTYKGLSDKERKKHIKKNKELVLKHVIPAYETLIKGLTNLKGTGKNNNGLCGFEKGKQYYEYLVASSTGSSKSIKEINTLLDTSMTICLNNISNLVTKDPHVFDRAAEVVFPHTDPKEAIGYLKDAIKADFPTPENVNCSIKYVHESLEKNLSPAFYLAPAIDCFSDNCIYINQSETYDLSDLFTTIAHESYPGHLYQTVYYNQQNPHPIRNLLNFSGYAEGWATYAELYSYDLAQIDTNAAQLLEQNLIATLIMHAKADIGVNYLGWTLDDLSSYLSEFGYTDKEIASSIRAYLIQEPANYMKYTLGYLELLELRQKAEKKLGNKFHLKDFHDFILKTGPAPFDVINNQMGEWMKEKK